MIENILTVGTQVLILFILIGIGFTAGKTKILDGKIASGMSNLVLYFVSPCTIFKSFLRPFDVSMLQGLGLAALAGVLSHLVSIFLGRLLIHDKDKSKEAVMQISVVFSNCGFMSLPLQQAILGNDGVFYGAAYIAIFNICLWSYGLLSVAPDRSVFSIKKIVFNPNILAIALGLIFFFCSASLPEVIFQPVSYMAALNTPVPMIIIGYHLSQARLGVILKDPNCYWTMALRLLISPILTLALIMLLQIRGDILVSSAISATAPVAAAVTMFADLFAHKAETSVGLVSCTTLLSILTMPLIVGLTQSLAYL